MVGDDGNEPSMSEDVWVTARGAHHTAQVALGGE